VSTTTQLLILTADPKLQDEIRSAARGLGDRAPVVHFEREMRAAVEAVRSRLPAVVLTEMGSNLGTLKALAQDARAVSPETTLAAVIGAELQGEAAESTLLIEALRLGVKDFLRRPISGRELDQLLHRAQQPASPAGSNKAGAVVSFISNKGGVGKSTLSINAACGLALRHPGDVLLIDASLQMGVAASTLDLRPEATLTDAVRERDRLDETMLRQLAVPHQSGLSLLAAPNSAVEAAEINDEAISRIITLARRTFRYVIVDTFPLLDGVVIAILDLSDRAYIVLENVVPTLLGGVKLVELLAGLGYPPEGQRVLLNRYTSIAGSLRPEDVATRLGRSVDLVLPYDKHVLMAANTGRPYALSPSRFFGFGPPLKELIADVESLAITPRLPAEPLPVTSGQNGNGTTRGREIIAEATGRD
jgi:pilus assembly protein CpaE